MINRVLSLPVGVQRAYIYFIENTSGECIMIDCGAYDDRVKYFIESNDLNVKYVLLTHGHFDHVAGLEFAVNRHISVLIGEKDAKMLCDDSLNLGSYFGCKVPQIKDYTVVSEGEINLIGFNVKVIETPGHTEGSVCYLIEDRLFSGDTMFYETFGRCDLPTGDINKMTVSLDKLLRLDDKVIVYPGHGQRTTIGHERAFYKNNR